MNRKMIAWFSIIGLVLTACQPIPPPSNTTTPGAATETVTATTSMTSTDAITTTDVVTTTEITSTESLTATDLLTDSTSVTDTTAGPPSTPVAPTPSEEVASEAPTTCPAIESGALDVVVLPNWEVGDSISYVTHHNKVEFVGDDRAITLATTTPVTFTVVEVSEDEYILQLSYGQSELGETDVELPDPMASLFQTPLAVTLEYATDSEGTYAQLLNLDELQEQIVPLFDQVFDAIAESDPNLNVEALAAARTMVDGIISDPANFEALFAGDLQIFHSAYGLTFEDAEPLITQDLRPNLLGGEPIPSELVITPTHYNEEMGCLRIEFENIADPVATRNSILEALQLQAQQLGMPGPRDQDLPAEIHLVDKIIFDIDLIKGWPTYLRTERAISLGDQGQVETNEYRLATNEMGE